MKYQHYSTHHETAKHAIAFFIVLVAFSMLAIFYNYSDQIIASNQFYVFMTLATVGGGLLIGLLYLVNKPHQAHKTATHKTVSKKKKKK